MKGVYLLVDTDYNLCKIGMSTQLKNRVTHLNNIYNFDLIESLFLLTTYPPNRLETTLHFLFREFKSVHPKELDGYTEFYALTNKFINMMRYFIAKYSKQERFKVYRFDQVYK